MTKKLQFIPGIPALPGIQAISRFSTLDNIDLKVSIYFQSQFPLGMYEGEADQGGLEVTLSQ